METTTLGSKAVGSIIKIKESGVSVEFYVAKHDYESGLNGSGRTLVVRKDIYDKRQWDNSNKNAYATSSIDAWLNSDYKNLLSPYIQEKMGTTKFYYTPGYGNKTVSVLERAVFLLSYTELGGPGSSRANVEGTALDIVGTLYKLAQWSRTPRTDVINEAHNINDNFGRITSQCQKVCGSRPTFALQSTMTVYGDALENTAPTTPGTVTAPSTIDGGSTITVSWTASTDAEGNLEGYKVERSIDGGSTWTQVYQGAGLSTTNTVAFGTETVMYRVCAYDSGGLASGWRTSAQVTVVNNHAPTAPASITVPGTVLGGSTLAVGWGAATDQDGDLSGYALERQVDGEAWTEIFTGNALSHTDTITRGWQTVAYRVRACDSHGAYSGYTTSPARTVNNNVAPVITCATASGTDLGVKSAGFGVDYSASDADGDAVTITETVDNKPWRTFIAGAGQSYTLDLTGEAFMKLLNGDHALKISANDGQVEAVHSLSFVKEVTAASVTLIAPMEADAQITICVLSVSGSIPADAAYSVKVTNNANDAAPVWEDCTAAVRAGANHIFANESAANGFAFNFKVEVERGTSGQGGYITSVQGGFQ